MTTRVGIDRTDQFAGEVGKLEARIARLEDWQQRTRLGNPIDAGRLPTQALSAALMIKGQQPYQSDAEFTASNWQTVAWNAFSVTFGDGSQESVNSGSVTLDNDNPFYLYWRDGFTSLQSTQTYSDVLGDDRALLAVVQRPPTGDNPQSQTPAVHTVKGLGQAVHSGVISANAILANHLQASSVTAIKVAAGAIETAKLDAGAVTAAKMTVAQLSAISADMGSITAGTVTGATVRTASGNPRLEMNSTELAGYDSNGVKQFYLQSGDGKAYAGGGAVVIDSGGIAVVGTSKLIAFWPGGTIGQGDAWYIYGTAAGINLESTELVVSGNLQLTSIAAWLKLEDGAAIGPRSDTAASLVFRTQNIAGTGNVDHKFVPSVGNWGYLGDSTKYWARMYADTYYGKNTAIQAFDSRDDIAMVEAIKTKNVKLGRGKRKRKMEVFDSETMPASLKDERGEFLDMGAFSGMLLGTLRQLIGRVRALEAQGNG